MYHKIIYSPGTPQKSFYEREMDIMTLIAKGYSNKSISKELFISEGTVANYITSILGKTGLEHRTQIAILKEKENRTYFRIMSAPIEGKKYVLSNVIVNMIIMTIQVVVTLTVMTKVFGISTGAPFWEMIGVMMFFSLVSVGLSLVITAFARNSNSAGALQNLIITPTCLLAGCFWQVEILPKTAQKTADFLPQRWLLFIDRIY